MAESIANTRKNNTICITRQRHSCSSPDWIRKNCCICHPDHTESPFHKTGYVMSLLSWSTSIWPWCMAVSLV